VTVSLSNARQASNPLESIALADASPLEVALVRTGIGRNTFATVTVNVATLLVTGVAPTALTTTRYWSLLSEPLVSDVSDNVAEVAPLTLANVVPASSLFCHWYVSVPLGETVAVTENVAAPLAAVWFAGCVVMVIASAAVVHVLPLLLENCTT
jgi:hypothetical protein